MDLETIKIAIECTITVAVEQIQLPGIEDAELRKFAIDSERLKVAHAQIMGERATEIQVWTEIALFIHISNTDVLEWIEAVQFTVDLHLTGKRNVCGVARSCTDWAGSWERALMTVKQTTLASLREDVSRITETVRDTDPIFMSAMVLLASEMIGPYVDRLASFLGYPRSFVEVVGSRLVAAEIWQKDEVRCEAWFDPKKGAAALLLDTMVAGGDFSRTWSVEKQDYVYRCSEFRPYSHMTA